MIRPERRWLLPFSVLIALLLGLLPLPDVLHPLRPYWLALALAFWMIETPERAGLGLAFSLGLLADLVFGSLLGEQALRLLVLGFILQRFRLQLRFFPLPQQMLVIAGLLFNDLVVQAIAHFMLGEPLLPWPYWLAPVFGMLLWPAVFTLLSGLRWRRKKDA